jgi:hypothetical protein
MKFNGEAVAEVEIKASHLTIYHAKLRDPLSGSKDPYGRLRIDRDVAKLWTVASFGNSKPATQWPSKTLKDYKEDTGKDLGKVIPYACVAFIGFAWDLQFSRFDCLFWCSSLICGCLQNPASYVFARLERL